MGRSKEQWIAETGGFRIGESLEITLKRRRIQELANKLKSGSLNDDERSEYICLVESLPNETE
jgi:hypothetical protein